MATIKPIEGRSVHQIQSGQVIVDLNSVCKELVENSLDAGATSIEVRFKNSGLDSIEVQDNGAGIAPEDYDTIALKHYTSKLASYDDLSSLQTFGFRGEALSSLCALSKFHIITTRASDGPKGTKLEFEQSGKLKGTSVVAAKQGSTVVVEQLFYNLPVRRKELEKTIKREYSKVLQLLNAYACISTGVKFSVSNQVPKGKKTVAFSTNTNPNTKENIANVYGAKTLLALIPLNLEFAMDPSNRPGATQSARNWSTQEDSDSHTVKIVGHISRPVVGEGRQTPDRQMFFVNTRPCALPQVAKAFNEVYRSYNITQSAFIFADIKLDTNAYDVNVSPDKRTIMLHDQSTLLENLKKALVELFENHDQSVPLAQLPSKKTSITPVPTPFKPPAIQERVSSEEVKERNASIQPEPRKLPSALLERSGSPSTNEEFPRPGFTKASLLERFAERHVEERPSHAPARRKRRSISPDNENVTEERVFLPHAREKSPLRESLVEGPVIRPSQSPLFEPESEAPAAADDAENLPQVVKDFNARMGFQHTKKVERERSPGSPDSDVDEEESIPVITQTPQKRHSQSTVQNAFDRMRPMRTPAQQATITIGDTTTVSTVGGSVESRASKRARIHTPKFGLNGTPLSQTPKRPLFMKSLRGFAAPGTQAGGSDEEDEIESSMPIGSARSPTRNRSRQTEFEEPRTDDLAESSSAPPPKKLPLDADTMDVDEPIDDPPVEGEGSEDEYIDETEKKAHEEAKIAKMIAKAEEASARPTELNLKRAIKIGKVPQKKYQVLNLERMIDTDVPSIASHLCNLTTALDEADNEEETMIKDVPSSTQLQKEDPEERLSLTVTKADFLNMRIIGQFNLGFILAVRPPTSTSPSFDLFIIDQHASDEKYNFERLSATTILVSQRLVRPHLLELTAVEEEIMRNNEPSLTANGFVVDIDTSGDEAVGQRAKLTSLPMSKEVTFTPKDLEELLALILDDPPSSSLSTSPHIPRPSKVRKLLASRACRSSVMIGKTLKTAQMENIVQHMGTMDKPWSCPHGRPTMRHLYGLEKWEGWREGDGVVGLGEVGMGVDWGGWMQRMKGGGDE
ncbi:DNA mismatch repair protein MutL [Massarina eburnea CBS 473.64]|uniref:DNA mismatch repair protein PMS1 n=1 Tax=Massarina eburnea CBS 473.64 TaxID=1395130 RepID=A0A6A6RVU3_9PLEO|nr:DNA mismatch repair protein MutL [Massarina eburnea CBS 473.64]